MTQTILITLTAILSSYAGMVSLPFHSYMNVQRITPTIKNSKIDKTNILWLARVIFSETKNKDEMRLIGWVVRNRVDAKYRGNTYKKVALSASQFSGLNPKNTQYKININMKYGTKNKKWKEALLVANKIYFSKNKNRPFPKSVLHFYSPISIKNTPNWVKRGILDKTVPSTNHLAPRFAFYSGVK